MRYISRPEDPERYLVVLKCNGKEMARLKFLCGFLSEHWYDAYSDIMREYTGEFEVVLYEGTEDRPRKKCLRRCAYTGSGVYDIDVSEMFKARLKGVVLPKPVKTEEEKKEEVEMNVRVLKGDAFDTTVIINPRDPRHVVLVNEYKKKTKRTSTAKRVKSTPAKNKKK